MQDANTRPRPRRSRQARSKRRRHILRTLRRQGFLSQLEMVQRGATVWLHSPQMARTKAKVDGV